MANRKTFSVRELVININYRLEHSTCTDAERFAMISVLENVLHETGNYAGFQYLGSPADPSRHKYYFHGNLA
jgi:hypothetical protein